MAAAKLSIARDHLSSRLGGPPLFLPKSLSTDYTLLATPRESISPPSPCIPEAGMCSSRDWLDGSSPSPQSLSRCQKSRFGREHSWRCSVDSADITATTFVEEPAVEIFFLSDNACSAADSAWKLAYQSSQTATVSRQYTGSCRQEHINRSLDRDWDSYSRHERTESAPAACSSYPSSPLRCWPEECTASPRGRAARTTAALSHESARAPLNKAHSWNVDRHCLKKPIKSIMAQETRLKHACSMGRKVRFNKEVEVYVYQ